MYFIPTSNSYTVICVLYQEEKTVYFGPKIAETVANLPQKLKHFQENYDSSQTYVY